ncbi:histamine H2 receptor-like [Lytechinus pictus]|uniref:histamine H2 receptor-like n=1 Tax=Lytechinus pictus TaxID=7653 RepID=UPI0030BA1E2A
MASVNASTLPWIPNPPIYTAFIVTLAILLICSTVVGNFLVVATFLKTDRLRRPTYYLLSSLAFVDLLNGAISIPVETFNRSVFIEVTCLYTYSRYLSSFTYLFGGNSLLHIVMVTLDRYIAVHKPLRYEALVTSKRIAFGILLSWLMSILFVIGLVGKDEDASLVGNYCAGTITQTDHLYRIGIIILMIIIILSSLTLVILNMLILRTALHHARRIAQMEQAVGRGRQEESVSRIKASKIVTTITLAFFVCYIPTSIVHVAIVIDNGLFNRPFDDMAAFIFYLSSAVNPVIYCYRDRLFRENAVRFFKDITVWRKLCSSESTFD